MLTEVRLISVSISGSVMVLGAYAGDGIVVGSGAAYVFDTAGTFVSKLTASDGAGGDYFGYGVAVDGSTIVVGASRDNGGPTYVFDTAGTFVRKILAPDSSSGDNFGVSVGVSGLTIVVGAHRKDESASDSGAAYVFDTSGRFVTKLVPGDGAPGDFFGWSVAISDSTIVVGAYKHDISGADSGAAYVFDTMGNQLAKLVSLDGAASDLCGFHVAIYETTVLVSCGRDDDNGTNSGSAYIYDTSGTFVKKLIAPDGAAGDEFGISVGVSESFITVAADKHNGKKGAVYVFDTTGEFLRKVVPDDGANGDQFGRASAISGSTIVVGAYKDDDNGSSSCSAYVGLLR